MEQSFSLQLKFAMRSPSKASRASHLEGLAYVPVFIISASYRHTKNQAHSLPLTFSQNWIRHLVRDYRAVDGEPISCLGQLYRGLHVLAPYLRNRICKVQKTPLHGHSPLGVLSHPSSIRPSCRPHRKVRYHALPSCLAQRIPCRIRERLQ